MTYRIALRLANIISKIMFCSANLSIHHAVGVLATGRRTARTSRVLQVSVVPLVVQGHRVLREEEQELRDIVKHIIRLKVTCTLKSALHSCRLSTRCQSGSGSPQALTKKRKIPSEMEVAPHYTLFTLFTLFELLCQSGSCSPQLAQIKAKSLKISNK